MYFFELSIFLRVVLFETEYNNVGIDIIILNMIQRFLKFAIRKDILKKNKPINHAALVKSMHFGDRVPFVLKYHKKKTVAFILAGVIVYTYDLQKCTSVSMQLLWRKLPRWDHPCSLCSLYLLRRRKSQAQYYNKIIKESICPKKQLIYLSPSLWKQTNICILELGDITCSKSIKNLGSLRRIKKFKSFGLLLASIKK